MLCISGFVHDVKLSHNGPFVASCVFLSSRSIATKATALISTIFC